MSMKNLAPQVGFGTTRGLTGLAVSDLIATCPLALDKNGYFGHNICCMQQISAGMIDPKRSGKISIRFLNPRHRGSCRGRPDPCTRPHSLAA